MRLCESSVKTCPGKVFSLSLSSTYAAAHSTLQAYLLQHKGTELELHVCSFVDEWMDGIKKKSLSQNVL